MLEVYTLADPRGQSLWQKNGFGTWPTLAATPTLPEPKLYFYFAPTLPQLSPLPLRSNPAPTLPQVDFNPEEDVGEMAHPLSKWAATTGPFATSRLQ